jgi:hypothetical protein
MTATLWRSARTKLRFGVAVFGLAVAVAACSNSTEADVSEPVGDDESVYGAFPIDPPAGDEIVLTIVGAQEISFTMDELFDVATTEVTIFEPFVRRDETFAVVSLHDLMVEAGLTDDDIVETVALNDYRYSQRVGDLRDNAALLAVKRNGEPIPMDAGGPIRIVFANDSGFAGELDAWNWSLVLIQVIATP